MRSGWILGFVCAAGACGETKPAPVKQPAAEVAVAPKLAIPLDSVAAADGSPEPQRPYAAAAAAALPAANAARAEAAPIGHLSSSDRLEHLFESFAHIDEGRAHDDVRILQYGDSHTASDLGVAVFRRLMQTRFGDGGRGFVAIGKPWKTFGQDGVKGGMKDFDVAKTKFRGGKFFGDGRYGLLGVGVESKTAGARAWTETTARSTRIEIDYWQSPDGGSFDVFVDGSRAGRVAARAAESKSGWYALDLLEAPHSVEVRALGDGNVRVFGMTLDRAQAGVVVDALGINGAQIFTALRLDEAHFAEQLRHAAPDMVVLAYGTNEAVEPGLADDEYERKLVELVGRVERAAPTASCLLLGPPDLARHTEGQKTWRSWPRVQEIVAIQKRVSRAAGCAFYDQLEAMGGPGSMVQWAAEAEPRASRDRVHFLRSGYAQLATSFATDVLRAYDTWRADRGLPPTSAPNTRNVAAR